jgi:hypothetical protein
MMEHKNVLDISEVVDDSRKIRPKFQPQVCSDWVPHGRYAIRSETGNLCAEITYIHGIVHGPYLGYWKNGKVSCEGNYEEGKQEGIWHFYNLDGSLMEIVRFNQGKEIIDFPSLPFREKEDGGLQREGDGDRGSE